MTLTICKLCGEPQTSIIHQIEERVLARLKNDHPDWDEKDGACENCIQAGRGDNDDSN
jgi:hypothetical protein